MNIEQLKNILNSKGAKTKKSFGQNFLFEDDILWKIAETIPEKGDFFFEFGGGAGTLTEKLVERKLFPLSVFEIDEEMLKILSKRFGTLISLINKDASKVDFSDLPEGKGIFLGNLPYNISSPILFNTCYKSSKLNYAVFLLQKEVAQKVVAKPGERKFSPIAALINFIGKADLLFDIEASHFFPPPKVTSSLIKITFEKEVEEQKLRNFTKIAQILFSHRRKTLNNVFKLNNLNKNILEKQEIKPQKRIEELKWSEILSLIEELTEI